MRTSESSALADLAMSRRRASTFARVASGPIRVTILAVGSAVLMSLSRSLAQPVKRCSYSGSTEAGDGDVERFGVERGGEEQEQCGARNMPQPLPVVAAQQQARAVKRPDRAAHAASGRFQMTPHLRRSSHSPARSRSSAKKMMGMFQRSRVSRLVMPASE